MNWLRVVLALSDAAAVENAHYARDANPADVLLDAHLDEMRAVGLKGELVVLAEDRLRAALGFDRVRTVSRQEFLFDLFTSIGHGRRGARGKIRAAGEGALRQLRITQLDRYTLDRQS